MHDEAETMPAPNAHRMGGKKEIESISIEPAKNGGHTVRHSYKRTPVHRRGGMNAGLGYDRPEPDEFVFGPEDGEKMMAHVRGHLKVGKPAKSEAEDY